MTIMAFAVAGGEALWSNVVANSDKTCGNDELSLQRLSYEFMGYLLLVAVLKLIGVNQNSRIEKINGAHAGLPVSKCACLC